MAIKFFNIRSKEVRVAEEEPQIAALWSSSDRSPNITQGQDFGWRLAPEVVVKMKKIKQDFDTLMTIAKMIGKNVDEVGEPDILDYISKTDAQANQAVAKDADYTDEYNEEIRHLEAQEAEAATATTTQAAAPQESLEDLQKRVELEERLAAAREKNAAADTTTTTTTTATKPTAPKKP